MARQFVVQVRATFPDGTKVGWDDLGTPTDDVLIVNDAIAFMTELVRGGSVTSPNKLLMEMSALGAALLSTMQAFGIKFEFRAAMRSTNKELEVIGP